MADKKRGAGGNPSSVAVRRLQAEYREMCRNPSPMFTAYPLE